jgi:hypothetical protein
MGNPDRMNILIKENITTTENGYARQTYSKLDSESFEDLLTIENL